MKKVFVLLLILFSEQTKGQVCKFVTDGQFCLMNHRLKNEATYINSFYGLKDLLPISFVLNEDYLLDTFPFPTDNKLLQSLFSSDSSLFIEDSIINVNNSIKVFLRENLSSDWIPSFNVNCGVTELPCYSIRVTPVVRNFFVAQIIPNRENEAGSKILNVLYFVEDNGDLRGFKFFETQISIR